MTKDTELIESLRAENQRLRGDLYKAQAQASLDAGFVKSMANQAIAYFEIDLTANVIEKEIYISSPNGTVGLAESHDVSLPCSVNQLFDAIREKSIDSDYWHWFKANNNRDILLELTGDGPKEYAAEYHTKPGSVLPPYFRQIMPVVKNPQSGHMIARCILEDVTNRYMMNLGMKDVIHTQDVLRSALAHAYDFAYHADLLTNCYTHVVSNLSISQTVNAIKPHPTISQSVAICLDLVKTEHKQKLQEFLDPNTASQRFKNASYLTMEVQTSSGRWLLLELMVALRNQNGNPTEVVLIGKDISQRKNEMQALADARDAAESASLSKTRFLNSMSHDIRTPINAVIGYTDHALKCLDKPVELEHCLENIKTGEAHLLNLINDVLEMARIESGEMRLNLTPCYVENSLNKGIIMFKPEAEKRGITLEGVETIYYPYVTQDEGKNATVVANIIGNALKYTPAGGHVRVSLKQIPTNQDDLCFMEFKCQDDGIGMSEAFLKHAFDDFSREHTTTESRVQGTGLGLSIVKRLVEFMGGSVTLESKLGEGTIVTTRIPHALCTKEDVDVIAHPSNDIDSLSGKRILLVDDNLLNIEIVRFVLEETGLIIVEAHDGSEAVQTIKDYPANTFAGILMDIQMPVMNGYDATRVIRAMNDPLKANIPIIALTANALNSDKRKAFDSGMTAFATKPIDTATLIQTLKDFLG